MKLTYEIHDLQPFVNWAYFFHAWGLRDTEQQQQSKAEAEALLRNLDGQYRAYGLFRLFDANGDGDDIVLHGEDGCRLPMLRQQQPDSEFLCLSDFVAPLSSGKTDRIGLFATSVDAGMESDFDADPYQKMMTQLLADRLAEAAAEKMHEEVRRHYWGYAPDEQLTIDDQHAERFQGIRPAVGYPSLPDTSLNFLLDRVLQFRQIGIRLTESGAMRPHASVSGLMISLPQARYFPLGRIGEDQLADYALRRGLPVSVIRKFLAPHVQATNRTPSFARLSTQ